MLCMHHQTPAMLFIRPARLWKDGSRQPRAGVWWIPVGIEHAVAVLPKSTGSLREILAGSPVASFDNVRRLSREAADALSGALEGLAMSAGKQKQLASFGNIRLIMTAPEGKPKRLHSLAGKIVRYELSPVEEWKTMA